MIKPKRILRSDGTVPGQDYVDRPCKLPKPSPVSRNGKKVKGREQLYVEPKVSTWDDFKCRLIEDINN